MIRALYLAFAAVLLPAPQPSPRLALELQDYAALPITADNADANTRAQLARVNFLRDEPGGRRFFVNDLNGPLYLLDKQTKTFTKYLDFNGLAGRPGLFPRFTYARNFATGLTNVILDPDYARNGVSTRSTWRTPRRRGRQSRAAVSCQDSTCPGMRRRPR